MNIEKQLRAEHSLRNTQLIASYIGDNPNRLQELLDVFSMGDYRLTQRAAWPLIHIADAYPGLLKQHVPFFIQLLDQPMHVAVKRNVLRLLQDLNIPEEEMGGLADRCFRYLQDIKEPIAVKAFSMTILYHFCLLEPDLKNELIPVLEDLIPLGSSGIRARGNKILKLLRKKV